MTRFITLALATAAILLSGCAATVTRDSANSQALQVAPQAARSFVLEISAVGTIGNGPDWEAFKEEWQTAMTAATAARQASFAMAERGKALPGAPAVLVKLTVKDFRYVSQAKRYAVGVFTGNAFMDVEAEFVEHPTGKVLGTRKYQTASSALQGVFAAMTPKQVEAVAQQIVGEIAGR